MRNIIPILLTRALFLAVGMSVALSIVWLGGPGPGAFPPPDRKDPSPKKQPPMPVLPFGPTNWGIWNQEGKKVTLRNHPRWEADGEWRFREGKWELLVLWTWLDDIGKKGPGLYTLNAKGQLEGHWNYEAQVERHPDGRIDGLTISDWIFRVMPPAEQ